MLMHNYLFFFILPFIPLLFTTAFNEDDFNFLGFNNSNLILDGATTITSNGFLDLTKDSKHAKGHAFYPFPLKFKSDQSDSILSFSTTFVFAIQSRYQDISGQGFAFVLSPTTDFSSSLSAQYLGLFNAQNNGKASNHILAIELDTVFNPEFHELSENHVGININSLISNKSEIAAYFDDNTNSFKVLNLKSGRPIQVWVDFDGQNMQLNVTLSLAQDHKPNKPLISSTVDLSSLMLDSMYVGFSSSTGSVPTSHYILGWSFKLNGIGPLPFLPLQSHKTKGGSNVLLIWLSIVSCSIVLSIITYIVVYILKKRVKYSKILEDWELQYGPHRFAYEDLHNATKGFKEKELLGVGGFGRVYKGTLPPDTKVAIKRISHDSKQGIKEFIAEILSIGKLRLRNLVQLLGYCRHKKELLLVYDYMPNGSLDKLLQGKEETSTLNWAQRFKIIKGIASGLLYLHEDWEQVVIHRDIKAGNVLLDYELNGRLGDFGLSRLYNHGSGPCTTRVVGTVGYIAPELARIGKSSTATDVFAFGVFLLEVVCGRRPIDCGRVEEEEVILVDWVLAKWQKSEVFRTVDSRLGDEYSADEVEMVLKLGLLCSNPVHTARPSMRQVVQFLEGDIVLPELPACYLSIQSLIFNSEGSGCNYIKKMSSAAASISSLSGGRWFLQQYLSFRLICNGCLGMLF